MHKRKYIRARHRVKGLGFWRLFLTVCMPDPESFPYLHHSRSHGARVSLFWPQPP